MPATALRLVQQLALEELSRANNRVGDDARIVGDAAAGTVHASFAPTR
jgi:hypothetical protein